MARQLRPFMFSGAFLPDKGAWLRYLAIVYMVAALS